MPDKEVKVMDIITMDIPLFIRMLEYAREDAKDDMDLHVVTEKAIELTKKNGTLTMNDYNSIIGKEKSQIKEGVESIVTDESPDTITVLVKYNDRNAGIIMLTKAKTENTLEIVGVRFKKDYENLAIVSQGINSLWPMFKDINALIVAPKLESVEFWNKLGFSRISKNYLIANRGH